MNAQEQYGIRWTEFDKKDRIVKKEKFFKTEGALKNFVAKQEEKPNFNQFEAWLRTP